MSLRRRRRLAWAFLSCVCVCVRVMTPTVRSAEAARQLRRQARNSSQSVQRQGASLAGHAAQMVSVVTSTRSRA